MNILDEAQSTLSDFLDSFRRLNIESFMELFCEDASVFYPFSKWPKKVVGRSQIEMHFKDVFDSHRVGPGPIFLEILPVDVNIEPLGAHALVTFHILRDDGLGRRTLLLTRRDERLRVLHLHASNMIEDTTVFGT